MAANKDLFVEEIKMSSSDKSAFRKTATWKEFRKKKMASDKVDFITNSKLQKLFNLHHCNFDDTKYSDLTQPFLCLNPTTHAVLHFIYGVPGRKKNWRKIIEKLTEACEIMDKCNK